MSSLLISLCSKTKKPVPATKLQTQLKLQRHRPRLSSISTTQFLVQGLRPAPKMWVVPFFSYFQHFFNISVFSKNTYAPPGTHIFLSQLPGCVLYLKIFNGLSYPRVRHSMLKCIDPRDDALLGAIGK